MCGSAIMCVLSVLWRTLRCSGVSTLASKTSVVTPGLGTGSSVPVVRGHGAPAFCDRAVDRAGYHGPGVVLITLAGFVLQHTFWSLVGGREPVRDLLSQASA